LTKNSGCNSPFYRIARNDLRIECKPAVYAIADSRRVGRGSQVQLWKYSSAAAGGLGPYDALLGESWAPVFMQKHGRLTP
jgi:hypothetical protein